MTKIKAVCVPVYELFAPSGKSLGLFRVQSEWKGIRELKLLSGDGALIVDGNPQADSVFGVVFADIFPDSCGGILTILKGSPEILAVLKADIAPPSGTFNPA